MPLVAIPFAYWAIGGLIVATGATIAWQRSGAPEKLAQSMSDMADNMGSAEEDAAAQDGSGARATTCLGDCPPPTDPVCAPLYSNIDRLTKELASRRADMLADRPPSRGGLGMYELFLSDPAAKVPDPRGIRGDLGNWAGHRTQIEEKQINLRSRIAEYRAKPCSPLPPGAETQAYLPPPTRPFH